MDIYVGHIALVLITIIDIVIGGYEHTCPIADRNMGARSSNSVCGPILVRFLIQRCGGELYQFRKKREASGIFLSSNKANSYLRVKRSEYYDSYDDQYVYAYDYDDTDETQGVACECCINTCTAHEMSQYCASDRKRRSIREILTTKQKPAEPVIKEDEVSAFYESLKHMDKSSEGIHMSVTEEYITMQKLESIKRKNIEREEVLSSKKEQAEHDSDNQPTKPSVDQTSTTSFPSKSQSQPTKTDKMESAASSLKHKHRHRHKTRNRKIRITKF